MSINYGIDLVKVSLAPGSKELSIVARELEQTVRPMQSLYLPIHLPYLVPRYS